MFKNNSIQIVSIVYYLLATNKVSIYTQLTCTCINTLLMTSLNHSSRFGPYFVEPVIAGLDPKTTEPYIASLDLIGCPMITDDFVVSGTCTEQLYGMCESLWVPDLVSG